MWSIELLSVSIICLCHQAHMARYQRTAMLDDFIPTHGSLFKGSTRSKLECSTRCESVTGLRSFFYVQNTHECECYGTSYATSDGLSSVPSAKYYEKQVVCDVNKYLVTGPDGVADSQLSASSFFCDNNPGAGCITYPDGWSSKYARLTQTGENSGWAPALPIVSTDHIQVDFLTIRLTTGIVLNGRDEPYSGQYVTTFKVLYSIDCVNFAFVQDGTSNDMIFVGSSSPLDLVTRMFEQPIPARCIRINPTAWSGHPSLRFDVLGC